MRALRAVAVVSVLGLLGLLVWDLVHQNGPGVAVKVDEGKIVAAPKLDLPLLTGSGQGHPRLAARQGRGRQLLAVVLRPVQARGA